MIIKQVHIFNYGKWHDITLPLRKGLNILYGRNEAGKTTLLSFIRGVLFGYVNRHSSHKNYIPSKSKNYGGQLEIIANDQTYIVQRMAGKNGGQVTILNNHGDQLDKSLLKKILGPFDRNTFDALYYFGTVDLRKVGKLKQRDLIYRIQRIGLAHSNDWIDYREALNKDAKKIYTPRGYKPPLNQKLKRYARLLDQIKTAKSGYTTYQELLKAIDRYHRDQHVIQAQLDQQNQRVKQVNQAQNTWLQYQKVKSLRPVMNHKLLPGFTADDADHLQQLSKRLIKAQEHVKLINQQIDEASSQVANDGSTRYYVQHLDEIRKLADQFNDVERKLQQVKLSQEHLANLNDQLKTLRSKYLVNDHVLRPMSRDDYQSVQHVADQIHQNQTKLQVLSQRLLMLQNQSGPHNSGKDYVTYGISGLLILVGAISSIWLIAILGIILGIIWFAYRLQAIKQNHAKLNSIHKDVHEHQQATNKFSRQINQYQSKYHYPDSSVEKWIVIQDDLKRIVKLTSERQTLKQHITQLTNDLNKYFNDWSFMNRQLTLSSDRSSEIMQLKNYVAKMHQILTLNKQADQQRQKYQQQLDEADGKQRTVKDNLDQFYQDRHVKDANEFTQQQKAQTKLKQQQATYRDLSKQIGNKELATLKHYQSYGELKALKTQITQEANTLEARLQDVTKKLTADQVKLDHLIHNGSYDELQQRAANARTEINTLVERWLDEVLASQWINAALNLATKGRVPKIERQAQANFKTLTNGRYVSIVFNKTQIKVMRNDKQRFTLYELSKGTVQQLYLALIFAMAQVFGTDYPMPIIVDDGFTDFDVTRRKAAVNLLKQLSDKLQVIYCTSDENFSSGQDVMDLNQL
ncbi:ATP-binding protein [Acetilactobacillus jinshanensis]|uniref:YhaN AAA domain-containing protein n=1 Tax=Acetilactobacillus jinshanensis TaxID=1720083 RepID=A0A4P6ZLF6_9LACO|nr:AAA family ATPase [Acetilactobacillus jinshanensis]QBP18691.1 hypothetical protein ELX58_06020 [Acetilactobacillus jinshanensis]URL61566.1 AAA family ATPase [uncultured bacterium]